MNSEKTTILLVEDDSNLGTILKEYLVVKDFNVTHVFNGEEGLKAFQEDSFDICVLDVMMPKMDGFTLAKKIVSINSQMPFLFLTAKALTDDKLHGLKIGADDYITKPFSMEELILRIKAILKRTSKHQESVLSKAHSIGNYIFDYENRLLKYNTMESKLTSKESELLNLLCMNKNKVLNRSEALQLVWKEDNYFTARSMDVYITKLRGYLKADPSIEIVNVHGTGFKLHVK